MEYGEIIGGAWRMTSRNRGLWLLAVILFVALVIGSAVLNTYLWHYWTLAYLCLTGALATAAGPSPPAPGNVVEPS